MDHSTNPATLVAWGGGILGFIFGAVANRTNFCTMGSVSDVVNMGSWGRMRMWLLAIAVAVLGAQGLHAAGVVDLGKSIYTQPSFRWLSYIVGGFLFGVGMTLGSGCGSKTLVRLGGGSLKSLVVFVFFGVAAYATLKGLFAVWRTRAIDVVAVDLSQHGLAHQDLPTIVASTTGIAPSVAAIAVPVAFALALLAFVFKDREFRASADHILGGAVIGLTIVGGWYVTGHLGFGEDPNTLETVYFGTNSRTIESLSYTAPVGYTIELLMLWTDASLRVSFGIAAVIGIVLGSFAYAIASRTFRFEGFAGAEDTVSHVLGGVLMGFGGVTALGCTIGQGLTGMSTLALGSLLAFAAIVSGSALTMKWQYWRIARET